jgi:hypothetical protein
MRAIRSFGTLMSLAQMSPEQRLAHNIRVAQAKAAGRPKPKRPMLPSRPGEPPRLRYARSPLKSLLFFGYDKNTDSVVVGPQKYGRPNPDGSTGAQALEHGGRGQFGTIQPRQFMAPALAAAAPNFARQWATQIK